MYILVRVLVILQRLRMRMRCARVLTAVVEALQARPRRKAASVCGLQLLVYGALNYDCMQRP
jgi:hypothetical protein